MSGKNDATSALEANRLTKAASERTSGRPIAEVERPELPAAKKRVAVLGAGRTARAMALVLSRARAEVRLYARRPESRAALKREVPALVLAESMSEAIDGAEIIFFAVPTSALTEVADQYGPHARGDHVVIHVARGVGPGFILPHQMIRAKTCVRKIGVLGGPLFSPDLDWGRPLAAVLASHFTETARTLQRLSTGTGVVVHASHDVIGVEVAGALSNVAAIAAGMAEGLELGDTVRGLLLTQNLAESMRLGVALGGEAATFTGLAGVGDLIPRRVTSTDRNRELGVKLSKGLSLDVALSEVHGEVEGITTAREAVALAARLGLEMPVARAVESVLRGEARAKDALEAVLQLGVELGARGTVAARR